MGNKPQRILVLYRHQGPISKMRAAIRQHLRVLDSGAVNHQILYFNALNGVPRWLNSVGFDAVIFHTTFLGMRWTPLFNAWKWNLRWLGDWDCLKIAMPQDEYDHAEVLDEWLFELGVSVIFTNFDCTCRQLLYPIMHDQAIFYKCFTGYVDDIAAQQYANKLQPPAQRPYDIVYRASHLPYWFGSQGQLKHQIGEVVAERAGAFGLRCNISTRPEDVILGNQWLDFLASGRVVIGCESGSSVLDRRGEIKAQLRALLHQNPKLSFAQANAYLSPGWDDYQFFAVSPRHFEAIIVKTCQVLVEGAYDGILEADKHYISLKRDFSNLDEVLAKIQDHALVTAIAERAYQDIYLSGKYNYKTFANQIEMVCHNHAAQSRTTSNRLMWFLAQLSARLAQERAKPVYWTLQVIKKTMGLDL